MKIPEWVASALMAVIIALQSYELIAIIDAKERLARIETTLSFMTPVLSEIKTKTN